MNSPKFTRINLFRLISVLLPICLYACAPSINQDQTKFQVTSVSTPSSTEFWQSKIPQIDRFSFVNTIRFDQFSLLQGLSNPIVTSIIQDKRGFLWFGTHDGLNRYDGYVFQTYRPDVNNEHSISGRWITSLAQDSEGNLWIGTGENGLNKYDATTGKFSKYFHDSSDPNSLINNEIRSLLIDSDGMVWIGSLGGLNQYDPVIGTFKVYQHVPSDPSGISGNHILSIFQDHKGEIWVGTEQAGVNHLLLAKGEFVEFQFTFPNRVNLSDCSIYSITEDDKGYLWFATSEGLLNYELATQEFQPYALFSNNEEDTDTPPAIHRVFIDHLGIVWIGTDKSLVSFDWKESKIDYFESKPGANGTLSNDTILSIFEDREGIIWVGTNGGGINKYNRNQNRFANFENNPEDPNSLSNNNVSSIAIENDDSIWLGTLGGGLNKFNTDSAKFTHFHQDPQNTLSLMSDNIRTILYDSKGILWIGTNKGLDEYNEENGTFNHFTYSATDQTSLSNNIVNALLEDSLGTLWIGTEKGLNQFSKIYGAFNRFLYDSSDNSSISDNRITTIFEDSKNNIWVGTKYGGLNKFDRSNGRFNWYQNDQKNPNSISNNYITFIFQDFNLNLWVGTYGGGINLYHPETDSFSNFSYKDGLPSNNILGIVDDSTGNLWVSTDNGIARFTPSLNEFKIFTVNDGLLINEFNIGAIAIDTLGWIYFGCESGLTIINPLQLSENPFIPQVVLTSLTQNGEPIKSDDSISEIDIFSLYWPNNSFEFEFSSLAFANPEKNQYAYFLEGFDKDWNYIGTKRNGKYTNLSGGTYTLILKGTNDNGIWNNEGTYIKVKVFPPFWNTLWFKVGSIMILIASIFIGYRLRENSINIQNINLEKQVADRTRLLNQRNWEIETLYRADEKMYRYLNIEHALQALVDVSIELLKAQKSAVFLWDDTMSAWSMKVNHGYRTKEFINLSFGNDDYLIKRIVEGKESLSIQKNHQFSKTNIQKRKISNAFYAEGDDFLLLTPIWIGEKIYGFLFTSFMKPNSVNKNIKRLFLSLCQRASLSIENAHLFEQSQELAVLEERTRLARDLHDSAKQKAFAALAQLAAARGLVYKNIKEGGEHIKVAEDLVSEVIQELTFLIQEMYPYALKSEGLISALRDYIFEWENRYEIQVNLQVNSPHRLKLDLEQALYRIIQEALSNIARHSHASQAEVIINYSNNFVEALILDNGHGFDPEQQFTGIGLRSMRERVCGLKGTFSIISSNDSGTKVKARIPF